jgi:hypothetical protein
MSMASGYVPGSFSPPPHGVDDAMMHVGWSRPSAQKGWSTMWAPMSPIALTPKSTKPRQLNG